MPRSYRPDMPSSASKVAGYNCKATLRPVNDSPLQALMEQKGLSLYRVSLITGICVSALRLIKNNQRLPNYIQAARLEAHLNIPHEAWLGTHYGKLCWEASKPRPDEQLKVLAATWGRWAHKTGARGKRAANPPTPKPVKDLARHLTVGTDEEKLAFAKKLLGVDGRP